MTDLGLSPQTLNSNDLLLKRTARDLGQTWTGLEGTLSGSGYRILIPIRIVMRQTVTVFFPNQQWPEEIQ
jgi:hypothetical protein